MSLRTWVFPQFTALADVNEWTKATRDPTSAWSFASAYSHKQFCCDQEACLSPRRDKLLVILGFKIMTQQKVDCLLPRCDQHLFILGLKISLYKFQYEEQKIYSISSSIAFSTTTNLIHYFFLVCYYLIMDLNAMICLIYVQYVW